METEIEEVNRWLRRAKVAGAATFLIFNAVMGVWLYESFARPFLAVLMVVMFANLVNYVHTGAALTSGLAVMILGYGIGAVAAWLIGLMDQLASDYTPPEHSTEELLASQGHDRIRIV